MDILGIKLYDPVQQIMLSMRQKGDFSAPGVTLAYCVSDRIDHDRRTRAPKPGESYPYWLPDEDGSCIGALNFRSVVGSTRSLSIKLSEDVPAHPGCMVAHEIYYDQTPGSGVNLENPEPALISKYGPPPSGMNHHATWGESLKAHLEYTWEVYSRGYMLRLEDEPFAKTKENEAFWEADRAKPREPDKF